MLLHFIEYRLDQLNSKDTKSSKLRNTVLWRLLSNETSAKSLTFFVPPTTKWRPCKVFAKFNGNHLLITNIFKFYKYQTFGLMKMHNMCKSCFSNNIFSLWKRLTGRRKYFFFIFVFSLYPNFKKPLSKILQWILRVLSNFYYVTSVSDLHIFNNEIHFWFFWNLHGYGSCFLIFSKWKEYYNLPFDDAFKIYCCALY